MASSFLNATPLTWWSPVRTFTAVWRSSQLHDSKSSCSGQAPPVFSEVPVSDSHTQALRSRQVRYRPITSSRMNHTGMNIENHR
ncbi:hypothetical protein MCETE7_00339 [Acidimicrobiia bacterium]